MLHSLATRLLKPQPPPPAPTAFAPDETMPEHCDAWRGVCPSCLPCLREPGSGSPAAGLFLHIAAPPHHHTGLHESSLPPCSKRGQTRQTCPLAIGVGISLHG